MPGETLRVRLAPVGGDLDDNRVHPHFREHELLKHPGQLNPSLFEPGLPAIVGTGGDGAHWRAVLAGFVVQVVEGVESAVAGRVALLVRF